MRSRGGRDWPPCSVRCRSRSRASCTAMPTYRPRPGRCSGRCSACRSWPSSRWPSAGATARCRGGRAGSRRSAGVFFAGDLLFWHHAIGAVGAGLATVLGNLQVLIVGVVAWLLLGERPSRATLMALPVVLAGVVLISGVAAAGRTARTPALGVVLGVVDGVLLFGLPAVIRVGGRDPRRPAGPVAVATVGDGARGGRCRRRRRRPRPDPGAGQPGLARAARAHVAVGRLPAASRSPCRGCRRS